MNVLQPFHVSRPLRLPDKLVAFARRALVNRIDEPIHEDGRKDPEAKFRRIVKDALADAIAAAFFHNLTGHLAAANATNLRQVYNAVVQLIQLDQSNLDDWLQGKSLPDANKYFLTLLAWPDESVLRHPPALNRAVIRREAIRCTVNRIAYKHCVQSERRANRSWIELTAEELCCICLAVRQPDLYEVFVERRSTGRVQDTFFSSVCSELGKYFPDGKIGKSADRVRDALRLWLAPYILFEIYRPQEWGFLHESHA